MNKNGKERNFIVSLVILALFFAALLFTMDKIKVINEIRSAVPLSQNSTAEVSLNEFYYTPEGVVLSCDERHGFANKAEGQFIFGLNEDEISKDHWQDKDYNWRARIFSNGQIIAAMCYNIDGSVLCMETPKNTRKSKNIKINSRYFGKDCDRFILYIKYNNTVYSADCTIVSP